ncbi:MAG: hypothetical protein FJ293_09160 [Planctomycetes bacterium]|nr:hypothetical protein [Planctomycetota bacterium]
MRSRASLLGWLLLAAAAGGRAAAQEARGSSSTQEGGAAKTKAKAAARAAEATASDEFFSKGEILHLRLEIEPADVELLRGEGRPWVACTLWENDKVVYPDVRVKLKGAAGSSRPFDEKPGLTLRLDKTFEEQRFHGMTKFHLNNAVQDDTWLHEWLGSELFRSAGLAATRVSHARVSINERDVGVYTLKEGFDEPFLRRWYDEADGRLYDGGFCQDIDAALELDIGKGEERADLRRLEAICREPDLKKRWGTLAELLDIEQFVSFIALEEMLGHWDGYCINKNNYRIYFTAGDGRAHFIPHGMDQLLQDPEAGILAMPSGMLANAVLRNPEWRALYRKKIGELLPLFDAKKLGRKVQETGRRVTKAIAAWDAGAAGPHDSAVDGLVQRIEARQKSLKRQKSEPDPKPLVFTKDRPVVLDGWRPASECEDARLVRDKIGGAKVLIVAAGRSGTCIAGWRRNVLLAKGRYRFQCAIQAKDVADLREEAPPGRGAGVRLADGTRTNELLGSANYRTLEIEFVVEEEARDVELVVELRASKGQALFKEDSLRLTLLGD